MRYVLLIKNKRTFVCVAGSLTVWNGNRRCVWFLPIRSFFYISLSVCYISLSQCAVTLCLWPFYIATNLLYDNTSCVYVFYRRAVLFFTFVNVCDSKAQYQYSVTYLTAVGVYCIRCHVKTRLGSGPWDIDIGNVACGRWLGESYSQGTKVCFITLAGLS